MDSDNQEKKVDFKPSYIKDEHKDKNVKSDNNQKRMKSKITLVILILAILVVISIVATGIYFISNSIKIKTYGQYEERMEIYGFERMYNNATSKTIEEVTQSEAIKLIVSTALNRYSVDDYLQLENEEYPNQIWVKYAENIGIIEVNKINKDNYNKKINLIDTLEYLFEAKRKILKKDADIMQTVSLKDYEKYNDAQKLVIQDMLWNKLITEDMNKLNGNSKMFKGLLNKLLIDFSQKYNTITLNNEKINIDQDKIPYNYDEYPYTLSNIKKEAYEYRFYYSDELKSILPLNMYADYKEYYEEYIYKTEKYLNTILNIDYESIDAVKLKATLDKVSYSEIDTLEMEAYVNYVKQNKIKISGEAKVQLPTIYHDGKNIRIRAYIKYNVINAGNLKDILFYDLVSNKNYEYKLGESAEYIDACLIQYETGKSYFMSVGSIRDMVSGQIKKNK